VLVLSGKERKPGNKACLHEWYRLNDPLIAQCFNWLGNLLQGDLRKGLRTRQTVLKLITDKLPVAIQLALPDGGPIVQKACTIGPQPCPEAGFA